MIVYFLYFLNQTSPAGSHIMRLYSSVCVGPVQKAHCWFSYDENVNSRPGHAFDFVGTECALLNHEARTRAGVLKFRFVDEERYSGHKMRHRL